MTIIGYPSRTPRTKAALCLTPACVHASSEILYNLSPEYKKLDPCDDFEELVCGGWDERHDLRPDQGDAFTGTIMDENSQMLLRHILEAPYPEDSEVCTCFLRAPIVAPYSSSSNRVSRNSADVGARVSKLVRDLEANRDAAFELFSRTTHAILLLGRSAEFRQVEGCL